MKNTLYIIGIAIASIIAGCHSHNENGHEHETDAAAQEEALNEDEVHLLKKQMEVMDIQLGSFQDLNLATTVKANGQLELPPQNQAGLSSVIAGRVKSIAVLEGDYVRKGQALARLEHPDFIEMQQEYMAAKNKHIMLEKNFKRKKVLLADSVSSVKSFELAESEYLSSLAKVNGLKSKLQLMGISTAAVEQGNFSSAISVRSPINGYVKHVNITLGKFVNPEEQLFEIVDNEHIHIDLMIYEKDINKIKKGQKVMFSLSNNPDFVFQGNIFAVGKSFEQNPKAMVVHAEIENKKGNLLPGMYVDARIVTNNDKVSAIPDDALVSDGGLSYIFVLQENEHGDHSHDNDSHAEEYLFKIIEVNTGASDIGFTEVVPTDHIAPDAQIVTKGAFYLLAEMKKGEGGHGHHH